MSQRSKHKYSKTGLMLVDDPRRTLETLCGLADVTLTWDTFKRAYERKLGRRGMSRGQIDTHFGSLHIYDLIIESPNRESTYTVSTVGKELCSLMRDPNDEPAYQHLLAKILTTNEYKGEIFQEFLKRVEDKEIQSTEDAFRFYRSEIARTLIAWTKEAGLIGISEERIWRVKFPFSPVSLDTFWSVVVAGYKKEQQGTMRGVRRVFIPIGRIRAYVGPKLGLTKGQFYSLFELLLGTSYKHSIRLYGGPTKAYETQESVRYGKKEYLYISLRGV